MRMAVGTTAIAMAILAAAPGATAADVSKVPAYDDFIVVPLRIHVLGSKTLKLADCTIEDAAVSKAAVAINAIWSKAGIHFGLESIIRGEAVQVERFKAVVDLNQGQIPNADAFAYLLPASSRAFDGLHVYLFHLITAAGDAAKAGDLAAARRYWTWLSEIPGEGAAQARRQRDALQ